MINFCDYYTDDKHRVRLEPRMDSMDPADYINASYIDVGSLNTIW